MKKITTADCIEWLIANYAGDTTPKDWKRVSKKKGSHSVIRVFKNKVSECEFTVHEFIENGQPKLSCVSPEPIINMKTDNTVKPTFYVVPATGTHNCGTLYLYMTDAKEYDANGFHTYDPPQLKSAIWNLARLGFIAREAVEGCLEVSCPAVDILIRKLENSTVFGFSQSFEMYCIDETPFEDVRVVPCAGSVRPKQIPNGVAYVAIATGEEPELALYVGDKGRFLKSHCQSDWTPQGTFEELERLGIPGAEAMEGMIEFYRKPDLVTLKAKLESSPFFEFSQDFEDYMAKSNGDLTIVPWNSIGAVTVAPAAVPEPPVTEQDCIDSMLGLSGGNWKRVSSVKKDGDIIHTMVQPTGSGGGLSMMVELKESKVREHMRAVEEEKKNPTPRAPYVAPYQPVQSDWPAIKANPVTANLHRAVFPKETDPEYQGKYGSDFQSRDDEWSGRVIFDLNQIEEEVEFYCGPECKGGSLEDTLEGGTDKELHKLLDDMNPEIGAAENYHCIPIIKGVSGKDMWKVIRERLIRSGAIQMDDSEYEDDEDDD